MQLEPNTYTKARAETYYHTWVISGPRVFFIRRSLPRPFSTTVGIDKRRSVCPVGAVSNTTTSKFIVRISLDQNWLNYNENETCDNLNVPHYFSKTHRLVNSGKRTDEVLHQ